MLPGQTNPFPSGLPSNERFEEAKKIEVRPRGTGLSKTAEEAEETSEVMLSFSCPACLEMMTTPRSTAGPVQCPECSAWAMPPKVVNLATPATGKTALPPPKKTGTQALRK